MLIIILLMLMLMLMLIMMIAVDGKDSSHLGKYFKHKFVACLCSSSGERQLL
jgi:hypothetical protein